MIFLIALLVLIQVPALYAQNGHIKNHELSGNEMDFWVGEWNLEWTVNGERGRGINSVIKTLGGAVIHQHFSGQEGPYAGFKGEGFTTFNPRAKTFFQTWVDNGGGYLDFTFQREGEKYIFVREADTDQYSVKSRMIFYAIKPHSFTWDWQKYNNMSDEWELKWRIFYTRKEILEGVDIKQFEWLAGRWKNSGSDSYEVWTFSEDQSSLKGYSIEYNPDGSDSTITERLKIEEREGRFVFVAHPVSSAAPTVFRIISVTDDNLVSYNPDHDFPQRIEYHRLSPQRVKAVIKNGEKGVSFVFHRRK